jgi:hypothetical protein
MGKYDDLFDAAPSPTPAAEVGKYSDLFDEPGVVATQQRDYASEIPSGAELTHIGVEGEKALPVFVRHALDRASHVVPTTAGELGGFAGSFFPPLEAYQQAKQGYDIATGTPPQEAVPGITSLKDLEDIKNQYGGGSPEYQAAAGDVAGDILPQMAMAGLVGHGLEVPTQGGLRGEPLATPELPPSPNIGPGTIAGDVSKALERRFTLQEPPPEPPLAPPPPIEDTLANIPKEPPVFNPELGPQTIPETTMPLRTEPAVDIAALQKRKAQIEASIAPSKAIGQRTAYDEELAGINGQLGVPPEGPVNAQEAPRNEVPAPGGVPVADIPPEDVKYAGGEPVPQAFSEEPHVSAIANRFTAERAATGELGEIQPGESVNTMDLVHHGLKMSPEQVNASVSRVMQGGDVPINDVAALRGEEARLSQRSGDLSRAARANPSPEAQLAADNAFKDLTDFHNGPVAQAKRNWHHQGKLMQGEIPVDLSTLNGMREAWLKDTGKPPPANVEPKLQRVADKLAKAIDEERAAARNGGEAIEKATQGRKMPTPEEVRNSIAERMGVEPCII